jgi:NAD(P)-dependent dehydrogenase (short-subunit alcohol dehydrogenase family)
MPRQAVARVWVMAGAEGVVIAGRRQEKLDEVIASTKEYNKGSTKVIGVKTDVKIDADTDNLFELVKATFGRPADVVYANAGWVSELKPSAEESVETWWSVYVSPDHLSPMLEPHRVIQNRRSTSWVSITPQGLGSTANLNLQSQSGH